MTRQLGKPTHGIAVGVSWAGFLGSPAGVGSPHPHAGTYTTAMSTNVTEDQNDSGLDVEALKNEIRSEVKADLFEDLREEVKADLREDLREQVKAELREEVREEVKAEVREDFEQAFTDIRARYDAKTEFNAQRLDELQGRELERGAHLEAANVDPETVNVRADRLERFEKDEGTFIRLPESEDPLQRGGSIKMAHSDLLPIQQLARMDDDMLHRHAGSRPCRLAAEVWRARSDPDIGDNPWRKGSGELREYLDASDLKAWIRRNETGVSEEYGKVLMNRTINALIELSRNRLGLEKKSRRKDGLSYKERRLLLRRDAEIPGETPETDDELGEE